MSKKIEVLAREVRLTGVNDQDYVCLTEIARYKDPERTDYLIFNWLRNRNTLEFLGLWEQINNPDHGRNLTRRGGERGDFAKDQSSPVKTSSSASSAPPREPSDIARYKDSDHTDGFNHIEFDGIRMQAGFNSFVAAAYACPSCRKGRRGK